MQLLLNFTNVGIGRRASGLVSEDLTTLIPDKQPVSELDSLIYVVVDTTRLERERRYRLRINNLNSLKCIIIVHMTVKPVARTGTTKNIKNKRT